MANETAATGVAELDRALDGLYWATTPSAYGYCATDRMDNAT
ncbi:MAG TPA: hypothetical protein VLL69_00285 [Streptosporangiaceae bacterium]|nr:hypothetical protein [Streptosporangiaceae bacterium]